MELEFQHLEALKEFGTFVDIFTKAPNKVTRKNEPLVSLKEVVFVPKPNQTISSVLSQQIIENSTLLN